MFVYFIENVSYLMTIFISSTILRRINSFKDINFGKENKKKKLGMNDEREKQAKSSSIIARFY